MSAPSAWFQYPGQNNSPAERMRSARIGVEKRKYMNPTMPADRDWKPRSAAAKVSSDSQGWRMSRIGVNANIMGRMYMPFAVRKDAQAAFAGLAPAIPAAV